MNKKIIVVIIVISVIVIALSVLLLNVEIKGLFSAQYNENGISHFLVVTIDEDVPREYIGVLDKHKIYIEKLDIEGTNFRNVDAENVSIKKAIEEKLTSIKEWKEYASKIEKDGDAEILKFDNYEIACAYDDCIIRPLSR